MKFYIRFMKIAYSNSENFRKFSVCVGYAFILFLAYLLMTSLHRPLKRQQ